MKELERLLSIQEVAERLGVKQATIYSWTHQRKIPYVKAGRLLKFERQAIDAWIEKNRVESRDLS